MDQDQFLTRVRAALAPKYEVEREIGRGGMATVYLARDVKLDRKVAVKVLDTELGAALGPERFRREIDIVAKLEHPHILPIYDSGDSGVLLYYIMPFIEGETLGARLKRERQLPVEEAVKLTCQVASALEFAHKHGIVHRDIKPENILLQDGTALVADFGIARAMSQMGDDKLTQTGITLGTPLYMSPEQATGERVLDGRSDLYALGCVLYEMLAGTPPFTGPTAGAIIARHTVAEVPSITVIRGTVPPEVEDVVMRALAKVPADRFKSTGEFGEALRDSLASGGTSMGRADRRKRPRKKAGKQWYAIAAAALLVVAGGGAASFFAFQGAEAAASRFGGDHDPNNIAVLYFEDRSRGGELKFLADGLSEALIAELSGVRPLRVVSRNGVLPLKGQALPTDSIARMLRVGTLVTGSVEQSGERLRVRVALVDALTGREIGSNTLDRPRADVFELQDELATEVSQLLRRELGQEIQGLVHRVSTRNGQAWESMQRASQTLDGVASLLGTGDTRAAVQRLQQVDKELAAVETLDPRWAGPIVQRGWVIYRNLMLLAGGDAAEVARLLEVAGEHADRALEIAPNDLDAIELRANVRYRRWLRNLAPDPAASHRLLADAEADFQTVIQANPLQASALNIYSHLLLNKSQAAEAKLAAQTAYESDPYLTDVHNTIWRLHITSVDLGNRQEAEKWCAVGMSRFPENLRFTECRLWIQALPGTKPKVDSLWRLYDTFVEKAPATQKALMEKKGQMMVALGLIRAGLPDSARSVLVRNRDDGQLDPGGELVYIESLARAQLGDKDDAIRLYTRSLAGNPQTRPFAKLDQSWWLEPIRDDPRYKALVGADR